MSKKSSGSKAARDNRANQLNPKHPSYWSSRADAPPPKAPATPPAKESSKKKS